MADLAGLARNRNVYDAASTPTVEKLRRLDFTELNKKAQEQRDAEISRKQQFGQVYNTGLYEKFNSDIRRQLDAMDADVEGGKLDPSSQEYQNKLAKVMGNVSQYKQISSNIDNARKEYEKDPSKFGFWDKDGKLVSGQEGWDLYVRGLNEPSAEGEDFETITTDALAPQKSFHSMLKVDETALQENADNFLATAMQDKGLDVRYDPNGVIVMTNAMEADPTLLANAKTMWKGQNSAVLNQMYGQAKAKGLIADNMTIDTFAENEANLRFPTKREKITTLKSLTPEEKALKRAQAKKAGKEARYEKIPVVTTEDINKQDLVNAGIPSVISSKFQMETEGGATSTLTNQDIVIQGEKVVSPTIKATSDKDGNVTYKLVGVAPEIESTRVENVDDEGFVTGTTTTKRREAKVVSETIDETDIINYFSGKEFEEGSGQSFKSELDKQAREKAGIKEDVYSKYDFEIK